MRIALQLGKGHFEVSHPKEKSLFSVKIILLAKRVYIKKPSVGVEEKECLRDRSIRRCITSIIKIIVGLLMNNSFQFVQNSQLNASRSKETHLFSKGQRFRPVKTSKYSFLQTAARNRLTTSLEP
jgi:hypothetical protein